jgi:hypothetical protein
MQPGLSSAEISSSSRCGSRGARRGLRMVVTLLAGALLAGCQAQPKETVAPPADEQTLTLIRQSFTATDPKAIVGLVIAVLPDQMYAAVGDVDVKDFTEGEVITFIDTNKKPLVNGVVKKVTEDALDVRYEMPAVGSRAPMKGDLAVRFKP